MAGTKSTYWLMVGQDGRYYGIIHCAGADTVVHTQVLNEAILYPENQIQSTIGLLSKKGIEVKAITTEEARKRRDRQLNKIKNNFYAKRQQKY